MDNTGTARKSSNLALRYLSQGYAVAWADGTLVEHSIATADEGMRRLAEHVARVDSQEEWDRAHEVDSGSRCMDCGQVFEASGTADLHGMTKGHAITMSS